MMVNHFKREMLVGIAYLFGGVLAVSAGLYFISNDLSSLVSKIMVQRAFIASQSQSVAELAELEKDSAAANAYKQAMAAILVTKDQLLDFPRWLNQLAQSRQVNLSFSADNSPVDATPNAPGYNGFTLQASGPIQNDIDFIRDIELRAPRFLVVLTSFDVTRSGSDYTIRSHGNVYFK